MKKLMLLLAVGAGYVLGTRAGRERYEQMKKQAQQLAQNPAVRNTAESAAQQGREFADKAYHAVSDKVGDRMPDSVAQRVHARHDAAAGMVDEDGALPGRTSAKAHKKRAPRAPSGTAAIASSRRRLLAASSPWMPL